MPSADIYIRHQFAGGFATDLGPATDNAPQGGGSIAQLDVPFLAQAKNIMFELDGGFTKCPGTATLDPSSTLPGTAPIRGVYDYWIQGTTGAPTQARVVFTSTKIYADDGSGTFTQIYSGISDSSVPSFSIFNDTLIMSTDGNEAPLKWLGTGSAAVLGGTPPNFAFSVEHKGRLFAGGVPAHPSRLYYSDAFDHENGWTNYITIGTDDGSGITGITSFKDALVIFKGPKRGSIYVLQGDDPTTFSLSCLRKNCGSAVWQNAIFQYQDDLAYVSFDGSIQRLSATNAYGSFSLAHLSRLIGKYINNNVVRTYLRKCVAVNWESKGLVTVAIPINSSSYPNCIIAMDYRFGDEPRFAIWDCYSGYCNAMSLMIDESDNSRQVVMVGGNDGNLRKLDVNAYSIEGLGINALVQTPTLSYGTPQLMKVISGGSIGFAPYTDDPVTFSWYRDNGTYDTISVDQGGGDILAPTSGTAFTLDTSYLGGGNFNDQWFELENGGEFRNISYQVQNSDVSGNFSIHSLSAFIRGGALSMENA